MADPFDVFKAFFNQRLIRNYNKYNLPFKIPQIEI